MNIWYSIQKSIILQSKHWNISNISLSSFRSIRLSQIIPKYLQVNKLLNIIHLPRSTNTTTIVYIYIYICQSIQFHSFTLRFHNTPLLPNLTCRWIIVTNPSKPSDPTIANLSKERNSIKIPCSIHVRFHPDPLSLLLHRDPLFPGSSLFISNGEEKEIRRGKMEYECVCANARARRMHISRERVAQAENGAIT